jgi:hypothetical protein
MTSARYATSNPPPSVSDGLEAQDIPMVVVSGLPREEKWDYLQQPAHPSQLEPQYRVLLAAIDMGWRVEEPVYLRSRWSDAGPRVYHFILRRSRLAPPRLLSVPQGADVDDFVRAEGLRLVVGR